MALVALEMVTLVTVVAVSGSTADGDTSATGDDGTGCTGVALGMVTMGHTGTPWRAMVALGTLGTVTLEGTGDTLGMTVMALGHWGQQQHWWH